MVMGIIMLIAYILVGRTGFIIEGRAREAVWRDGRFWDEIHMGILDQDWQAQHREPGP
jgi:RimJ/RimL family protein N-acetyltransferase